MIKSRKKFLRCFQDYDDCGKSFHINDGISRAAFLRKMQLSYHLSLTESKEFGQSKLSLELQKIKTDSDYQSCFGNLGGCTKQGWKHYQTFEPPPPPPEKEKEKKKPQVGRGLFGVHLLILHFKFQFSKSIKSSTFHIFLNLTYPEKISLSRNAQKSPKTLHKTTKSAYGYKHRDLALLET